MTHVFHHGLIGFIFITLVDFFYDVEIAMSVVQQEVQMRHEP